MKFCNTFKRMADGQKPAYGCEIAPPVPPGTVLKDTRLKTWTVGKAIGAGGFGAIYGLLMLLLWIL